MRDPKAYAKKVETYVDKYASNEDADNAGDDDGDEPMSRSNGAKARNGNGHTNGDAEEEDDEDDKMSDMGELSDGDEFMGEMDD